MAEQGALKYFSSDFLNTFQIGLAYIVVFFSYYNRLDCVYPLGLTWNTLYNIVDLKKDWSFRSFPLCALFAILRQETYERNVRKILVFLFPDSLKSFVPLSLCSFKSSTFILESFGSECSSRPVAGILGSQNFHFLESENILAILSWSTARIFKSRIRT